jgi:hypothetical protein
MHYSILSFGFLFLLSAASAVFVHQISPLRNPTFQPNSANAGSLLPVWRGVTESTWLLGASALAVLLAISLTIVFWQWNRADTPFNAPAGDRLRVTGLTLRWPSTRWLVMGITLFGALWLLGGTRYSILYSMEWWLRTNTLAALLSLYFTGVFWLWHQLEHGSIAVSWWRGIPRRIAQFFVSLHWLVTGLILFSGLQLLFVGYLLSQWLVD